MSIDDITSFVSIFVAGEKEGKGRGKGEKNDAKRR
jgi:hypothetical protein